VAADIVKIHWNARPCLDQLGANFRRGGIDSDGQRVLDDVRRARIEAFSSSVVLVRKLCVARNGDELGECLGGSEPYTSSPLSVRSLRWPDECKTPLART
jgi:hypothetical protein